MAKKTDIHVVPHEGGWAAKAEGNERASFLAPTKREAVDRAREMAKERHVELIIHNRDGKIADSDSYGKDPCPPRDKKH